MLWHLALGRTFTVKDPFSYCYYSLRNRVALKRIYS
jgi:hypothetical protein